MHLPSPKDMPGLAHFCEHMLFLGTEVGLPDTTSTHIQSLHGRKLEIFPCFLGNIFVMFVKERTCDLDDCWIDMAIFSKKRSVEVNKVFVLTWFWLDP